MDFGGDLGPTIANSMSLTRSRVWAAFLLAAVFLLAQFHLCADLSAGNNTHFCPVCSDAGAAIATHIPLVAIPEAVARLDVARPRIEIVTTVPASISPRAPPSR